MYTNEDDGNEDDDAEDERDEDEFASLHSHLYANFEQILSVKFREFVSANFHTNYHLLPPKGFIPPPDATGASSGPKKMHRLRVPRTAHVK